MGRKMVSAYVETEVDVDLDMFDENDIIEFLEDKGYTVVEGNVDNKDMKEVDAMIWELYQTWKLPCNEMDFWRAMHKFFSNYYNKVSA